MEYCSRVVCRGIKWLGENLETKLSEYQSEEKIELSCFTEGFYALSKVNHPLVFEFIKATNNPDFWNSSCLFEVPYYFHYLFKLGFEKNKYFKGTLENSVKELQTVSGCFLSFDRHPGSMRALVSIELNSEYTKRAIKYFVQNYRDFDDIREISEGILALFEYDHHRYSHIIRELSDILTERMCSEEYMKSIVSHPWNYTYLPVQALSYVHGHDNKSIKRHVGWLKKNQDPNGSWKDNIDFTTNALLALMSIGEGPKISKETWEQRESLYLQKMALIKSNIVLTNPFTGRTEIKEIMKEMIADTNNRLWICSRFITEFWTDIVTLRKDNPEMDIRIITIPKKEARKVYVGHGKRFLEPAFDTLQRSLEKNFKITDLLHARCIITDDTVLISSADLSEEQLEKEFNLGIWTRDPEVVQKSVEIFENFWEII